MTVSSIQNEQFFYCIFTKKNTLKILAPDQPKIHSRCCCLVRRFNSHHRQKWSKSNSVFILYNMWGCCVCPQSTCHFVLRPPSFYLDRSFLRIFLHCSVVGRRKEKKLFFSKSKVDIHPPSRCWLVFMKWNAIFPRHTLMHIARFSFGHNIAFANSLLCRHTHTHTHIRSHARRIVFRCGRACKKLDRVILNIYAVWQNTMRSGVPEKKSLVLVNTRLRVKHSNAHAFGQWNMPNIWFCFHIFFPSASDALQEPIFFGYYFLLFYRDSWTACLLLVGYNELWWHFSYSLTW